jgi:sulfonate transport system ATP-binding protein
MTGPAVALPRLRDIAEVRPEPAFHRLHRDIWAVLKAEVLKTYRPGEAT